MRGWDYAAIITLATVGFTLSYDALRQVAIAIHVRPNLSYLFPIVIDGFIAYGVRAIVLLRHHPFPARLYAWFLFLAGTGASLWANALHAVTLNRGSLSGPSALHLDDRVVGVLSTLAPLALAGSVHLYTVMARTAEPSVPDRRVTGPGPAQAHEREDGSEQEQVAAVRSWASDPASESSNAGIAVDGRTGSSTGPAQGGSTITPRPVDLHADQVASAHVADNGSPHEPTCGPPRPGGSQSGDSSPPLDGSDIHQEASRMEGSDLPDQADAPVRDGDNSAWDREAVDEWMKDLLPIAREASERAGRISRSVVQDAVRAHQPISNDRLGALLAHLKQEAGQVPQSATARPGGELW
ncbi:hypothetical protein SMD44_p20020 (plasmid) [Streptomyces alboflavus]|uniref:DUF2637 domain-containing protein n=1 Tax=Streptomyces alboflavus TaxID=67267 RepID=A0A291W4G7_9ACTN|nr:DUF2637 domain-containing protein [Streptomyces alboflavus]ATM24803.1 hypothetical protein SMD44_p20020 [Streptomyces alboflavus]